MTYDNTDERGEDAVARQRGGSEPGHLPEVVRWSEYVDGMVISPTGYFVTYADHVAALRACEARVQERWRQGDPLLHEQQRQWYASGYDAAVRDVTALEQKLQPYQRGYAAGVQAARDAVAALFPQERYPDENAAVLVAIDALRATP